MSDSDPLIDALTAPSSNTSAPGRTSEDLAAALGTCKATVIKKLKLLKSAGRIRVHRGPSESIDGRMLHTTTYELVKDDKPFFCELCGTQYASVRDVCEDKNCGGTVVEGTP